MLRTRLDLEKGSTSNFGRKRTWTLTLNQTRFKSSQLGLDLGQVGSDLGQVGQDQVRQAQAKSGRLRPSQVGSDLLGEVSGERKGKGEGGLAIFQKGGLLLL
jgi:hypothetical protein